MNSEICLITGATSGIGKATALAMAKKGYQVILVGRNEEKAVRAREEIIRESQNDKISYQVCNISSVQEVRGLSARIKRENDRIDILINNAGARFLRHHLTYEGIEMTLATNHLGHFVLTQLLIDMLGRSRRARIINVSSRAHYAGTGAIENILSAKDYDGRKQYSNSKLANVLFTYGLADKLKGGSITVNAADPGVVATNFARNDGWVRWLHHRIYYMRKRQLLTPEEGAETIVYLACSAEVVGVTGKYFLNMKEKRSSDISYNDMIQKKLWVASVELSGIGS